ncbi:hypothetical protein C2G38_2198268 [Gigaspora rosea]|uniref:BTB domain-containing protein n=1 Tax=Gigaspora rosea TaxID=44941 RepID=A0A397UVV4_9GLOM|nr:hypothetical protein C2G38_2198268 [Gigaspora rosea]
MVLKFFEKLSNSYLEFNDEEDFNIIIDVGESPNTKIFRAHSIVLKYSYLELNDEEDFNIIIDVANINSNENHVKMVNLKHVSIQQFGIIINYLELLNDEEDFNIIINVDESPNTKIF